MNGRLAAELLKQGYRYRGLRGAFSGFCRRRCVLISEFSVGLGSLLHQGLSRPGLYGDLVRRFRGIVSGAGFSGRFRKIIMRRGRVGYMYDLNVMQPSACLVIGWWLCFGCAPVGRVSAPTWSYSF